MLTKSTLNSIRAVHDLMKEIDRDIIEKLIFDVDFEFNFPNEPYPCSVRLSHEMHGRMTLLIFRGPDAREHRDTHEEVDSPEETLDFDCITMMWCPFDEIDHEQQEIVRALKISARRDTLVPIIGTKKKGTEPVPAKLPDLVVARYALIAVIEADKAGYIDEVVSGSRTSEVGATISGPLDDVAVVFDEREDDTDDDEVRQPSFERAAALATELAAIMQRSRDVLPEDADLEDWTNVTKRTLIRLNSIIERRNPTSDRALAAYFGDADEGYRMFDTDNGDIALEAFSNWRCLHDRAVEEESAVPTTILEAYAQTELPAIDRAFVEAWMKATPSLHRIVAVDNDELTLLDELSHRKAVVVNPEIADISEVDDLVIGAIIHVGRFALLRIYFQTMSENARDDAVNYLKSIGFDMSRDAFAKRSHLIGRLWSRFDELERDLAEFDDLPEVNQLHIARFSMRHPQFVRSAMTARNDIVESPDDDSLHWVAEIGDEPDEDGLELIYGVIRFEGDQLIVECATEEDCDAAIEWIEKLPGKVTVDYRTIEDELSPEDAEAMMERFEKMELSDELREETEKQLRELMEGWLDESNPALGGKTPRQFARTPEGRIDVKNHILSMQPLHGPAGIIIEPPIKLFLNELGLD